LPTASNQTKQQRLCVTSALIFADLSGRRTF